MSHSGKELKSEDRKVNKLSVQLKGYWGLGALGLSSVSYTINTQFTYFLVEYLGLSAVIAGSIYAVSRLYDAVTDPVVGALSDATQSRWGRRRPWILLSAFLIPMACWMLFHPPDLSPTFLTAYMAFGILFFYTGYTVYYVPHLAMAAEMTDSYQERTSLMAYNMFFASAAGFVGTSITAWLIVFFGNDREAYGQMSIPMGILSFICLFLCFRGTASARNMDVPVTKKEITFKEWWKTLVTNKPFAILIGAKFCHLFGIGSVMASITFFSASVLGYGQAGVATYGIGINLGQVLTLPLWVWLGWRFPKHQLYACSVFWFSLICLSFMFIDNQTPMWIFFVQTLGLGFGAGGILTMGQSLLPDIVAYDRALTGLRREGMFTSVFSFMQKTAHSLAPFAIGIVLTSMGYAAGMKGGEQSAQAIQGVYIAISVVPAVALILSIPLLLMYNLTEKELKRVGAA